MSSNERGTQGDAEVAVSLRHLPHPAVRLDEELAVIDCSGRCLRLFGVASGPDEAAGLAAALAADEALGDELALATARLAAGDAATFDWRRGDDVFEVSVAAEGTETGAVESGVARTFFVWFADVGDTRRLEAIQQEVRHYLEQVLADVPLGVAVLDAELRVTFVNAPALGLLGRLGPRRELVDVVGADIAALGADNSGRRWRVLCGAARDTGRRVDGERQAFGAPAEALVLEAAAHPLHDRRGAASGAILVLEDVTEKARLEADMVRMEKLATVGQMVITVNHEINNPLAIIKSNAQAARLINRDLDAKTVARLQRIEEQVDRIGAVTERLRTMDDIAANDYIADGPKMIDVWERDGGGSGHDAADAADRRT